MSMLLWCHWKEEKYPSVGGIAKRKNGARRWDLWVAWNYRDLRGLLERKGVAGL